MISKIKRALSSQEKTAVVYSAVPIIPTCRPIGYFLSGCKIVCLTNGTFYRGEVTENWGTMVTIKYEKKVFGNENYLNGYGGSCGLRFIGLLHLCEYKFLKENPDFAERFFVDSWISKRWQCRYPQYNSTRRWRKPKNDTFWENEKFPSKRSFSDKSPRIEEWQRVANEFLSALR